MVICLERGAYLHMAQLMPLPLTVPCFSRIQIGFAFLVPAHPGSPGKGPLNGCVCVSQQLIIRHQTQQKMTASCTSGSVSDWACPQYIIFIKSDEVLEQTDRNMRLLHISHIATFFVYFRKVRISHIFPHKLAFATAILVLFVFLLPIAIRFCYLEHLVANRMAPSMCLNPCRTR